MSEFIEERRKEAREARAKAKTLTREQAVNDLLGVSDSAAELDAYSLKQAAELLEEHGKDRAFEYLSTSAESFVRDLVPKHVWAYLGGSFVYE